MFEVTSNLGTDLKKPPHTHTQVSQIPQTKRVNTKEHCLPGLCQRFCVIKVAEGHERLVSLVIERRNTTKKNMEKKIKKKEDNESKKKKLWLRKGDQL